MCFLSRLLMSEAEDVYECLKKETNLEDENILLLPICYKKLFQFQRIHLPAVITSVEATMIRVHT